MDHGRKKFLLCGSFPESGPRFFVISSLDSPIRSEFLKTKAPNSEFRFPANSGFVSGSEKALPEAGSVAPLPALIPAGPEVPSGFIRNAAQSCNTSYHKNALRQEEKPMTNDLKKHKNKSCDVMSCHAMPCYVSLQRRSQNRMRENLG